MERRLPHESAELIARLTSWIDWRYASSRRLLITSAPTALPFDVQKWRPGAVWRLAWESDGTAMLYGLAPGDGPSSYYIVRRAATSRAEGVFRLLTDGTWKAVEGDGLALREVVTPFGEREAA